MKSLFTWVCMVGAGIAAVGCSPELTVVSRIEIPLTISEIGVADDAVWVKQTGSDRGKGPGTLLKLDPELTRVVSTIPLDASGHGHFAVGEGSVWVIGGPAGRHLYRIDSATHSIVATIPIDERPEGVAVGEGAVWVVGYAGVHRIDPRTNQVTSIPIGIASLARSLSVGADAVWLTGGPGGEVYRIDPEAGRVVATTRIGQYIQHVVAGEGSVWILGSPPGRTSQPTSIWRIDLSTNQAIREPIQPGNWAHAVAGGGYLWIGTFTGKSGIVSRIDPRTLETVGHPIEIGSSVSRLAFGLDSVWVLSANGADGHPSVIQRITPMTPWQRILRPLGLYKLPPKRKALTN